MTDRKYIETRAYLETVSRVARMLLHDADTLEVLAVTILL